MATWLLAANYSNANFSLRVSSFDKFVIICMNQRPGKWSMKMVAALKCWLVAAPWVALWNQVESRSSGQWKQRALPWLPWTLACLCCCFLFTMAPWSWHQRGNQHIVAASFFPASLVFAIFCQSFQLIKWQVVQVEVPSHQLSLIIVYWSADFL